MSDVKHTPGNLIVERDGFYAQIEGELRSCEHWNETYFNVSGYFGSYGPELFAAAPDLLEALKSMMAMHAPRGHEPVLGGPYDDAREAIAKAEGRT